MQVLWWLVPSLVATAAAMGWAAWVGRERDDARRDDTDASLAKMQRALSRPPLRTGPALAQTPIEPTHGVAVRRNARRQPSTRRGTSVTSSAE
jgi:hypothetical protein